MMMKLVCPSNGIKPLSHPLFSNVLRALYYSTKAKINSSGSDDTLYRRISPVGDFRVSIVPILEQWVDEGKSVHGREIRNIVRQLRVYRRYHHALEVSRWMSNRRYIGLSRSDVAVRLDLIAKVHGLEKAEEYFDNIPKQFKHFPTYGALLNCYAHAKSVEKAEALMQLMRKLGYTGSSLTYNVMLNLYSKTGQYEKLDPLMEEMTKKGITKDMYTFSIQLAAYVDTSDIDKMERLLQRIEVDPIVTDWSTYIIASKGYIKAGFLDKALAMLKKSEELIPGKRRRVAYDHLLSSYGSIGRKDELYRIWDLCKSSERLYNSAYHRMIVSLLKLGDIVGAEKIFQEWEAAGTNYDFRVVNSIVLGYCEHGFLEKAEKVINDVIEKGEKPWASTWENLAAGFIKADRFPEGVEAMKKAILASPTQKPDRNTLTACLNYLKEKGDSEKIYEFASLLGVPGPLTEDVCKRLLSCFYGGETESVSVNDLDGNALDFDDNEDTRP